MSFFDQYKQPEPKSRMPFSKLGAPTSPFTPNQLDEFGKRLNTGMKNVEVGTLQLDQFEGIPKQHFEEIRRLSKLTNANVSLHGPLLDLSGFGEKNWSEHQRKEAEEQMASVLNRVKEIDHEGKMPVVFHASHNAISNMFDLRAEENTEKRKKEIISHLSEKAKIYEKRGDELEANMYNRLVEDYAKNKKPINHVIGIVNQDSGETTMAQLSKRREYNPLTGKMEEQIIIPEEKVLIMNHNQWENQKTQLFEHEKKIQEIKDRMNLMQQRIEQQLKDEKDEERKRMLIQQAQKDFSISREHINILNKDMGALQTDMWDKFDKWATADKREEFKAESKELMNEIEHYTKQEEEIINQLKNVKSREESMHLRSQLNLINNEITQAKSNAIAKMEAPDIWRPTEDFAKEKFVETVSNALIKFAEQNKDFEFKKAPIVAIENFFPERAMGTAEALKNAVESARDSFAKKLSEKSEFKKIFKEPEKEAKKIAEKTIGVTWDMGHINQLRKFGYSEEELKKRVIAETQKIADVVKHVHITDNFGFTDAHLPPGMGNVPIEEVIKEIMERKKGEPVRGIVEAGNFVKEFKVDPTRQVMEYFGSPYFDEKDDQGFQKMGGNYWVPESPNFYRDSFMEFPQQHFNLYGSSFSTLPKTFGGQIGSERSRFSDTPNN